MELKDWQQDDHLLDHLVTLDISLSECLAFSDFEYHFDFICYFIEDGNESVVNQA
jgi:hypothetical protein